MTRGTPRSRGFLTLARIQATGRIANSDVTRGSYAAGNLLARADSSRASGESYIMHAAITRCGTGRLPLYARAAVT